MSLSASQLFSLFPFSSFSNQGGIHIPAFIGSLLMYLKEKDREVRWKGA